MNRITRFEDLIAWQKARKLNGFVFALTRTGRFAADYRLSDQICRAAISVAANIAEGFERDGNREFVKFLSIAKGSAGEVRSHLHLAHDMGYVSDTQRDEASELSLEVARLIGGLIRSIQNSGQKGRRFVG